MRMLVLSLKAITPLVHSQYRPTGHVTSRKVNIRAADCQIRQNSVVNSTFNITEEAAEKKAEETGELPPATTSSLKVCSRGEAM